ncbi:MAG: Asp-tRNA(Asn)/Glu-tRNA(Gln) amidotransferase subunit GatC [Bacteroidetes bacterium]|nr:Asp-tRNA(Asn)/Glu-tRNA(Gln) amidotransferase subunit GatC [Bacteroidota bacterium]
MAVTKENVEYIAALARLKFNDVELENYTHQLNDILKYVEKLNELNTDDVEPLSHPVENINVFREDKLKPSISTEEALKNAPNRTDEFFKVPKVNVIKFQSCL